MTTLNEKMNDVTNRVTKTIAGISETQSRMIEHNQGKTGSDSNAIMIASWSEKTMQFGEFEKYHLEPTQ